MYGRLCIKFPQSRMKGERHWAEPLVKISTLFEDLTVRLALRLL